MFLLVFICLYLSLFGFTWLYLALFGFIWFYVVLCGFIWLYLSLFVFTWLYFVLWLYKDREDLNPEDADLQLNPMNISTCCDCVSEYLYI